MKNQLNHLFKRNKQDGALISVLVQYIAAFSIRSVCLLICVLNF